MIRAGLAHCGKGYPWDDGPGLYKETSWENHEEQATKQHFSRVTASSTASGYLSILGVLDSLDDDYKL